VIWIGGLGAQGVDDGLAEIAKRIGFACDRQDVAEATFAVRAAIAPEKVGDGFTVPRATLMRTDTAGTRPVIDLYGISTTETLVGDRAQRSLPIQVGFAGRTLARAVPRAIQARKHGRGKTPAERHQLMFAWLLMFVMIAGFLALLAAFATTLVVDDLPPRLRAFGGVILAFGGWGIWKSPFVKKLGTAALVIYSVVDYLDRGEDNGSQLRGRLAGLLEYLAESEEPPATIEVVAYSFGSIVAIDALFPYVQQPPPRLSTIDRLITIACPYDFVRNYWPDYFTRRFSRAGAPADWINFYAPSDVLASNFRDDATTGSAVRHVEVREEYPPPPAVVNVPYLIDGRDEPVSGRDSLLLKGLRFHGEYWSSRVASEEGVFDQVIGRLGSTARPARPPRPVPPPPSRPPRGSSGDR
jgi:hypothetical protein